VVERSPLQLAAIASAAVPGLDPVTVESLPSLPHDRFDVAFVRDSEHRRWVVRAPRSEAAGAELDAAVGLLGLLGRRLSFAVPTPRGFLALKGGGRAAVYPFIAGDPIDFGELPDGPGLAAEIGRAIAAVHNLDPRLVDEAGLPTYDADAYRSRRLSHLDRAAATGRVPHALLERWERALEDVSLWRFAATPVHGQLSGEQVLVVFDGDDASTGRVRGLIGWERAQVADPADDFAALVEQAPPAAVERALEAYAHARLERPDPNLLVRARLAGELGLLRDLMDALARRDEAAVEGLTTRLRRLDEHVHSLEESSDDYQRMSLSPAGARPRPTPPPPAVLDDGDDEDDIAPPSGAGPAADDAEHAADEGPDAPVDPHDGADGADADAEGEAKNHGSGEPAAESAGHE
jgi:macrolide phosphotransferase